MLVAMLLSCASVPPACDQSMREFSSVPMSEDGWFWFADAVVSAQMHATWIGPKELLTDPSSPHLPSKLLLYYDPPAKDCPGSDQRVRAMLRNQLSVVSGRGRWNHDRLGLEVDCVCSVQKSTLSDKYGRFRGLTY
jgi:hypothetical protein